MALTRTTPWLRAPIAALLLALSFATGARAATTEYPVPTPESFPLGIAAAPDGQLWITEYAANRLARVAVDGTVTEFPALPSPGAGPGALTAGPDGALWFTEAPLNRIGRMTLDGTVSEFDVLTAGHPGPQSIAAGADGNLWFTQPGANRIGRITPAGVVTEFPLPQPGSGPRGIAAGPDGALWFTEYDGNRIGRITTAGEITEYTLPTADSRPLGIAPGPDGNVWFTEYRGNRIGRIAIDGTITELRPLELPDSRPVAITAGADGAMWFTEEEGNRIGRATVGGVVTESSPLAQAHSFPNRIVAGPDGNLWFTESGANAVARTTLDVPPLVTTGDATEVTTSSAVLTGTVNPSRAATTYWFEYGLSTTYGSSTPDQELAAGDEAQAASTAVSGLPPGTPVQYRLVARNANGRTPGENRTFATLPEPTSLGTGPAQPPRLPPVRLELRVRPRHDRSAPFSFRVRGAVVLPPGVSSAEACAGTVLVRLVHGRRGVGSRAVQVTRDCNFAGVVRVSRRKTLPRTGSLALRARFGGNARLSPRSARTSVRFGRASSSSSS